MQPAARILLNTVGTSLLYPNLAGLGGHADPALRALGDAFAAADWAAVEAHLDAIPPDSPLLGAETAAVRNLRGGGLLDPGALLVFLHSATEHGRVAAHLLGAWHGARAAPVDLVEIGGLQDDDPDAFARRGLPGLARELRRRFATASGPVAVNATGGRKAVVAVAVAAALVEGVPVYYQHERFDTVVRIPPGVGRPRGRDPKGSDR